MLTATVETRRAQFAAYLTERGADLCRWIVAGKLHNQEKLLRYFAKSRDGERKSALEGRRILAPAIETQRGGRYRLDVRRSARRTHGT